MGLLIGASVLTLFEVLDTILYNAVLKCYHRRKQVAPSPDHSMEYKIEPVTPQKDAIAFVA